jgi:HSP20 family protein
MQLIKWEPLKEIDRFFDDRFLQPFSTFSKLGLDLAVDVYEEKGNVVAKMSLPGIKSEELDISLEDDMLTISGRREEEKETDKKDYYSKEIRRGSFSRTVSLPKSVDAGKAEAKYNDGELVVTMPVIAGTKEKAIKVTINK